MTAYYVWSGATGTGAGTSWANAITSFDSAVASISAGDTLYVASDHSETVASLVVENFPGTSANPNKVFSVTRAGSVPPVAADLTAGAQFGTSGSGNTMLIGGSFYVYGMTFTTATGSNITIGNNFNATEIFDTCTFSPNNPVTVGNLCSLTEWRNCIWKPGAAGNTIQLGGSFRWIGGSVSVATATPTYVFAPLGSAPLTYFIEGVDFSAATGSTALVQNTFASGMVATFQLLDCQMPASVPFYSAVVGAEATQISSVCTDTSGSSSSSPPTRVEHHTRSGDLTTETTIVKTGGASDGTTGFSRNIATSSSAGYTNPFKAPPIAIWNDTVGSSVTVSVDGISNLASGAFPNNDDIWIEVAYLGTGTTPKASIAQNNPATMLTTHSAYTSSGATWGGSATGGAFKMSVTITPQKKGYIYVTVQCAKPSTTFYVDPLAVLT